MRKHSEFDVQATAYGLLKQAGYDVWGEIKIPKTYSRRGARFDLVIFEPDTDTILLVLEIKRAQGRGCSKQNHYEILANAPCLIIGGMEKAKDIVALVQKRLQIK